MAYRLASELDAVLRWAPGAPVCYPPHLDVGNLQFHRWKGENQMGRVVTCLVCNITSNTRNRNGDAKFIRAHRRCSFKADR